MQRNFLDIKLQSQAEQKAKQVSAVKRHKQARENIEAVIANKAKQAAPLAPSNDALIAQCNNVTRLVLRPGDLLRQETDEERRRDLVHFVVRPCIACDTQRWTWKEGAELPTCLTCHPDA
jgi:hypothetical protein